VNFEDVKFQLMAEGIEFESRQLLADAVTWLSAEEFGNFFAINERRKVVQVEPDCGKVYFYTSHQKIPSDVVEEFVDRVCGFNCKVIMPWRNGAALRGGKHPDVFGLGASILGPDGCLAVDDGEILSRK
jgi:hypothetical protein